MRELLIAFIVFSVAGCNDSRVPSSHRIGETALTVVTPDIVEVEETRPAEDFYILSFSLNKNEVLGIYVGNAPNLKEEDYSYKYSKNRLQHFCNDKSRYLDCYIKMGFIFPKYIHYQAFSSEHDSLVKTIVDSIQVHEEWLE